jgi:hypothetical protein
MAESVDPLRVEFANLTDDCKAAIREVAQEEAEDEFERQAYIKDRRELAVWIFVGAALIGYIAVRKYYGYQDV